VEGWRVDTLLAAHALPNVGFIKIDVQGAEMKVLLGSVETLARCRPAIFIEIDDAALRQFGSSAEEVLGWLESKGYRFSLLYRSRLLGVKRQQILELVARKSPTYFDVLAHVH
jgi:hypothetical protein